MFNGETVLETKNADGTLTLGRQLGREAGPQSIFLLEGDLGTGKTVLAHGIAQGLGVRTWRGSPTFNLIHEYEGRLPYFHIDAYRLTPGEAMELDLIDMLERGGVLAVEWPDRVLPALGHPRESVVTVHLEDLGEAGRRIELRR